MVVEILNADAPAQQAMVDLMKAKLGKPPSGLSGVWRIWDEHQAAALQTQGATVPVPHDTNPLHVFDIDPVTKFAGTSALTSFTPIPAYVAYSATTAFEYYEGMKFTITRDNTFTQIKSPMGRYNYAEFDLVIAGTPQQVADGVMGSRMSSIRRGRAWSWSRDGWSPRPARRRRRHWRWPRRGRSFACSVFPASSSSAFPRMRSTAPRSRSAPTK